LENGTLKDLITVEMFTVVTLSHQCVHSGSQEFFERHAGKFLLSVQCKTRRELEKSQILNPHVHYFFGKTQK
jgi:hypothetical protein